jgi:hypothetical protein
LSFNEALHLARNGMSYIAVVDALRYEYKKIENSAPQSTVLDIKINLAVALLDCANQSPKYDVYNQMYEESQSLLESVLRVQASNSLAAENLSALRKNRAMRATAAPLEHRKKEIEASGSFNDNDVDMQVQAPMHFMQS